MKLKRNNSHSVSENVRDQIVKALQAGEYKVGQKLPTEAEFCEMMKVSRPSVREALSALRLAGIIETRKGDGTYIKTLNVTFKKKAESFERDVNIFELLEARRLIEPVVAQLALKVMRDEYVKKMRRALIKMQDSFKNSDLDSFHKANKQFHTAIAEATRTTSLIDYVRSLINLFTESDFGTELRRRYLTDERYVGEALKVHNDIYDSIKARDPEKLSAAFDRHNDQVEKQLLGR